MPLSNAISFDPRTINALRQILDEAWEALPEHRKLDKSEMAKRILKCAGEGERDPTRLRAAALADIEN
jgi:hypothetical protein